METKALLATLGGSPDPIAQSILSWQPEVVCLLVSQDVLEKGILGQVLEKVQKGQAPLRVLEHRVTPDPENLEQCYATALEAARFLVAQGFEPGCEAVRVDYTGGTKSMTSATVLATVNMGWLFSYVGGEKRGKDGLGVVLSGTEELQTYTSPWHLFAQEEWHLVKVFFNQYLFQAAQEVAGELKNKDLGERHCKLARILEGLANAYDMWDRFQFESARNQLQNCLKSATQDSTLLTVIAQETGKDITGVIESAQQHKKYLDSLLENQGATFSMDMARDVYANALRRMGTGRYEDGAMRLYRVLEMAGQIAFEEVFGCPTDKVPPEVLREKLPPGSDIPPLKKGHDHLLFSLQQTYDALAEMDHPLGIRYRECLEDFQKIQRTRNHSMLVHKKGAVKPDICKKLQALLQDFLGEELEKHLPVFPKLNWHG